MLYIFLKKGCVRGISLYEKLWDHLGKREKLDLRSTKFFKMKSWENMKTEKRGKLINTDLSVLTRSDITFLFVVYYFNQLLATGVRTKRQIYAFLFYINFCQNRLSSSNFMSWTYPRITSILSWWHYTIFICLWTG